MAANTQPIFVLTPNTGFARSTAANTASDGSGTLDTLFSAGTNGSRVDLINIHNSQATAALSTALVARIFLTDTSGNNPRLIEETSIAATTRSTSVVGAVATITFPGGLLMASGQLLKCCVSVFNAASQVDFVARGGNY